MIMIKIWCQEDYNNKMIVFGRKYKKGMLCFLNKKDNELILIFFLIDLSWLSFK